MECIPRVVNGKLGCIVMSSPGYADWGFQRARSLNLAWRVILPTKFPSQHTRPSLHHFHLNIKAQKYRDRCGLSLFLLIEKTAPSWTTTAKLLNHLFSMCPTPWPLPQAQSPKPRWTHLPMIEDRVQSLPAHHRPFRPPQLPTKETMILLSSPSYLQMPYHRVKRVREWYRI